MWANFLKTKTRQKQDTEMALAFDRAKQQQARNQEHIKALEKAAMDGEGIWFQPTEESDECIIVTPRSGSMLF